MSSKKPWWEKQKIKPESIHDILERWLTPKTLVKAKKNEEVYELWPKVVDKKILKHTKIKCFRNHVLEIIVDSSAQYFELTTFHKKRILNTLRKQCTKVYIDDIRFTLGDIT